MADTQKEPPKGFIDALNEQEAVKRQEQDKADQLRAINKAGIKNVEATNKVTDGLKKVKGEVKVTNPDLAKSSDLQSVTDAVNKMNITAFMTNDGLPKLAAGLTEFTDKVKELSNQYKDQGFTELSKQLGAAVDTLKTVATKLSDTKIKVDVPLKNTIDGLQKSIKAIDFTPTVNVAAPKVTMPKLDTSGMERILTDFTSKQDSEGLDLDDYYAQDLDELEPGIQYVGFLNSKGEWYIIKNIEAENQLRYAFGNDSYADFWPKASQLDYKRLNEAVNAT